MLVPGEYLLIPVLHVESFSLEPQQASAIRSVEAISPAIPDARLNGAVPSSGENPVAVPEAIEPKETERRSFLMILLSALGAVHS